MRFSRRPAKLPDYEPPALPGEPSVPWEDDPPLAYSNIPRGAEERSLRNGGNGEKMPDGLPLDCGGECAFNPCEKCPFKLGRRPSTAPNAERIARLESAQGIEKHCRAIQDTRIAELEALTSTMLAGMDGQGQRIGALEREAKARDRRQTEFNDAILKCLKFLGPNVEWRA